MIKIQKALILILACISINTLCITKVKIAPSKSTQFSIASLRSALLRFAKKISITTASPAQTVAKKFLQNHAKRLAAGAAIVGCAEQNDGAQKQSPKDCSFDKNATLSDTNCWQTLAPSLAHFKDPKHVFRPKYFEIADLKREAAISYAIGSGNERYYRVAPSTLTRALENLTPEQEFAINKFHKALVDNAPADIRVPLGRDVWLLIRNEEERTEILDNLRWLQRDNAIGRTRKGITLDFFKQISLLSMPSLLSLGLKNPAIAFHLAPIGICVYLNNPMSEKEKKFMCPDNAGTFNTAGIFIPCAQK